MEEKQTDFKKEPRNVRVSLVANGVNPFVEMKSINSMWPIFVINNNIPPWISIKREHIMLAMIVPVIFLRNNFFQRNNISFVVFVAPCHIFVFIYSYILFIHLKWL